MNESIKNKTTNSFTCIGLGNCRGYERGEGRKEALSLHIGNASLFVYQFAHFDKMPFITSTRSFYTFTLQAQIILFHRLDKLGG